MSCCLCIQCNKRPFPSLHSSACRLLASISRNGVAVTNNEIQLFPSQNEEILLKVPPDNSGDKKGQEPAYVLRVEG